MASYIIGSAAQGLIDGVVYEDRGVAGMYPVLKCGPSGALATIPPGTTKDSESQYATPQQVHDAVVAFNDGLELPAEADKVQEVPFGA